MLGNVEHRNHNLRVCLECPGIKEVFEEKLIVILKVNAKIIDSCYCTVLPLLFPDSILSKLITVKLQ